MTRVRETLATVAHYTWLVVVTVAYAVCYEHQEDA